MSIKFEYPELLHASGVVLMINNNFAWGIAFCALGLVSAIGRFGNEISKQEELKSKEEDFQKELSSIGKAMYQALQSGLANNKNSNESDLH